MQINDNNCTVNYNKEEWLGSRFVNHFMLGIQKEIGHHQKNLLEKAGDVGLFFIENIPRKIWQGIKDPRVITIALTAFALLATSFIFYPLLTIAAIKLSFAFLPLIPLWTLKLSVYLTFVSVILSTAMRAEGRFLNADLMNQFYHTAPKAPEETT